LRWLRKPSLCGSLWLHRAALSAEVSGRWARAEFYWREFDAQFAKLNKQPDVLGAAVSALVRDLGAPSAGEAKEAGGRFVDEVLIDTHAALCNSFSCASETDVRARAEYHIQRLKTRLPDSGMTVRERATMLRPIILAAVQRDEEFLHWNDAAAQYRVLLDADPSDREAQDGIVKALWKQAESLLGTSDSAAAAQREAAALKPIVRELEGLIEHMPHNEDHLRRACAT
jgi:hypothetical protein